MTTKKAGSINKPAARYTVAFGANKTARKSVYPGNDSCETNSSTEQIADMIANLYRTYKAIARQVAGYRSDLLKAAVARASATRRSQRAVKPEPAQKLRGNAAKKAAASA